MPGARMFTMVTITLIAPMIEEAPIRWIGEDRERERLAGLQHERRIERPARGRRAARHQEGREQQQ